MTAPAPSLADGLPLLPARLAEPDGAASAGESGGAAAPWEALLPAVLAGDQAAAVALVEEMYPHVIRIVRSHLPARTDEQDVAQEVFMKMFAQLAHFRGDKPFPHWVARITTNTCYDLLRKQRVRPEIRFADLTAVEEEILANTRLGESAAAAPAASLEGDEIVEALLATLNPDQQLVVRLLDVEQLSVKEICDQTGWGASKVKVTAMRGRRKIAEALRQVEPGSPLASLLPDS